MIGSQNFSSVTGRQKQIVTCCMVVEDREECLVTFEFREETS